MNYSLIIFLVGLFAAHLASQNLTLDAQENEQNSLTKEANSLNKDSPTDSAAPFNVPFKTYGGTQFWTDHQHTHGYRLQSNWMTNHWRLLDASDVRRAWGTRKQCEVALGALLDDQKDIPKSKQDYVVLLHGLMRSHQSMRSMEKTLTTADCGTVLRFSYASTRNTIGDHAAALQEVLSGLPKDAKISFVAHSMGNIVVRHMLADLKEDDPDDLLSRCRCMVMLGPPNQGAAIARRLAYTKVFGLVAGKTGLQLGPNWQQLVGNLAVPEFPFSIIAGDLSQKKVHNPILDDASDFVVQVNETQLEGRESFTTVPVLHSTLMKNPEVQQLVVDFLQSH